MSGEGLTRLLAMVQRRRFLFSLCATACFLFGYSAAIAQDADDALPHCFIIGNESATLVPNLTAKDRSRAMQGLPAAAIEKYTINGQQPRWTATASNASVPFRAPFTLTYSFVPDGTLSTASGQTGRSNLFASVNSQFPGGMTAFKALVRQAFDEWGNVTGISYVETADDGAALPATAGMLNVRGDVRVAMFPFGGSNNDFLAFNSFPNQGDLVLNASWMQLWFAVPTNNFRRLRNTVSHEHGHGLGFSHVIPLNQTKLMESTITDFYDGLTQDEYRGGQRQYGDWSEANDSIATATYLGGLSQPANGAIVYTTIGNLALEGRSLSDFYRFNVPAYTRLTAKVTPVGSVYQTGPTNGPVVTVDGLRVQNLMLEIYSPDGIILQSAGGANFGESEQVSELLLTQAGGYYARISSTDGADDTQRYQFQVGYRSEENGTIAISQNTFDIAALPGQNPSPASFLVHNSAQATLNYSIASDAAWLTAAPASGSSTGESDTITINFATTSLAAGNYTGHLTVSAPNSTNSPQVVTVNLRISPPIVEVNPRSLNLQAIPGKNLNSQTFEITNAGLGSFTYTVTETSNDYTLSPSSGSVTSEADTITIQFNTSGLAPEVYSSSITIDSTASTEPIIIPVRIIVSQLNGWVAR